jgi:hypothetical protein
MYFTDEDLAMAPPTAEWHGNRASGHETHERMEREMTAPKKTAPTKTVQSDDFDPSADVTVSPESWEWETVEEGASIRVIFETVGDSFIGQFIGREHVDREPAADGTDQSFDLLLFRGRDTERYTINVSFALDEAMKKVNLNEWVRITYIKDVKTARKLNDMKDFRVDVRR